MFSPTLQHIVERHISGFRVTKPDTRKNDLKLSPKQIPRQHRLKSESKHGK